MKIAKSTPNLPTKEQWNCRIHPDFKRAAKIVAAMTDYTQDDLAELALAALFGLESKDNDVSRCGRRIQDAAKLLNLTKTLPLDTVKEMAKRIL